VLTVDMVFAGRRKGKERGETEDSKLTIYLIQIV
jgi:hypothetical protein